MRTTLSVSIDFRLLHTDMYISVHKERNEHTKIVSELGRATVTLLNPESTVS